MLKNKIVFLILTALTLLTVLTILFSSFKNETIASVVTTKEKLTQETSSPISIKTHNLPPTLEKPQIISNELYDEYYVKPPMKKKIVYFKNIFIPNINAFLKANEGNLEDLPLNVMVSLNRTLQKCAGKTKLQYSEE